LRIKEIRELDKKLGAVRTLEDLRYAVRRTDSINTAPDRPFHYRIEYDYDAKTVNVTAHTKPWAGIKDITMPKEPTLPERERSTLSTLRRTRSRI
jgi:hypothetical protein